MQTLRGLPVSKPTASAARVLPVPGSPVKRHTVPAKSPFLPKPHCPIRTALACSHSMRWYQSWHPVCNEYSANSAEDASGLATVNTARVLPLPDSHAKMYTVPAKSPFLPKPHCPIRTALACNHSKSTLEVVSITALRSQ